VWLHVWRPFCNAASCQFIAPYRAKAEEHDVKLFLISETYDFKSIDTIIKRADYGYPVFVVNNNYYGSKIDKSGKQFAKEIMNTDKLPKKKSYSDFLFKNGKLIYAGYPLLDSLAIILKQND